MKQHTKSKAEELLRSARLRRTAPRIAVMSVLLGAAKPITQDQIALKLGPDAPDKVTIYRILESFLSTGLVHKAYTRQRTWYFELAHNCTENQCHPHFTCTSCGETHCLPEVSLPLANTSKGFAISRQRVQLEGLCPKCNLNS